MADQGNQGGDVVSAVSNLVHKVAHFLHNAQLYVSDVFVALFGKDRAQAFGHAAVAILQTEAGKVALAVVEELEALVPALDGATKRAQAAAKLKSQLSASGHVIGDSLVNLLVELAVQTVKGAIKLP